MSEIGNAYASLLKEQMASALRIIAFDPVGGAPPL